MIVVYQYILLRRKTLEYPTLHHRLCKISTYKDGGVQCQVRDHRCLPTGSTVSKSIINAVFNNSQIGLEEGRILLRLGQRGVQLVYLIINAYSLCSHKQTKKKPTNMIK